MNGYDAYKKYVALKLHFQQSDYDYFKFSGSVKVSREKFDTRNDKYFFDRIAKLYTEKQFEQLLVANFVLNKDCWVGDILSDHGRTIYTNWKKTYQSLEYIFTEDMKRLQSMISDSDISHFDELFDVVGDSNWPDIVSVVFQHGIKMESFIIMNKALNFIPRIDKKIDDEIVWPEFKHLCIKYSPFLDVDIKKYKNIMKNIFVQKSLVTST